MEFLQMIDDFADALVVQLFYSTGVPQKLHKFKNCYFSTDQGLSRMFEKNFKMDYFILCSPRDKRSALQEPSNQYRCVWGLPHEYVWYLTIFIWVIRPVQISVLQRLKLLAPRVSSLHSHIFVRLTKPLGHGFTYDGPLVNELLKRVRLEH
ncbi:hypothetical protein BDP27DRAFT_918033 [Rhodocollybia butyracea]|uniref:Uncharacterized protein n=1 Tax=Rhodocollybia butyracea TaxID=206335 RepID=A0A9P5PQ76_9AGAR|nr:hypothetical protein BDP27DRAFT_918033 [Rhodocollybia butyracea]